VLTATLLLDRHAAIETRNNTGYSPLMLASHQGHVPVIELLLTRLVSIEAQNIMGLTALAMTCKQGRVPAATLLLDRHADIETRSNDGYSPLMWASQQGHVPVIELLCNRHAAIDFLNEDDFSALSLACMYAHVEAVRALLARGANIEVGEPSAIIGACIEIPEGDRKGQDLSAFWARRCEIVIELIRANANLNVVWLGLTPLQFARRHKQPAIIAVLKEALGM